MLQRLGTDAMLWAEEIASRKITTADDLLPWCANMMQAAADAANAASENPDPPAPAVPDIGNVFVVELKPQHAAYVRLRALAHGEQPGRHIGTIVRAFWASHDEWKRQNSGGLSRPGAAAVAP